MVILQADLWRKPCLSHIPHGLKELLHFRTVKKRVFNLKSGWNDENVFFLPPAFYRCGPGVLPDANSTLQPDDLFDISCTNLFNPLVSELYDPNDAIADILSYFQLGLIDDPKNMEGKPLYVFSGSMSYLFPLRKYINSMITF